MRLALVISSLGQGGAERVLSILSKHWVAKGYHISLIVLDAEEEAAYSLPDGVEVIYLDVNAESANAIAAIKANILRARVLRLAIKQAKPDWVIGFMTETAILCAFSRVAPVIAYEHSDPYRDPPSKIWRMLRFLTYPLLARIVVLNAYAEGFYLRSPLHRFLFRHCDVIANPVMPTAVEASPENLIVVLGRLSEVKRFDRVIDAFGKLAQDYPDWKLMIVGEGEERRRLQAQINALDLSRRISLTGWVAQPGAILRKASVFVLSSDYEGFPMALCEAMAAGVAVVSVRYHEGVNDIIRHGKNGLIAASSEPSAIAASIRELIDNPLNRERLAANGKKAMQRFSLESIGALWGNLLLSVR